MKYSIEQNDAQLLKTTAAIRYQLGFVRAAQHLLSVQMEIDNTAGEITLVMPSWMPGSYKIREMVANQGNLTVTDGEGNPLQSRWTAKNILNITANGANVIVRYVYFANERGVRTSHINRFHAFIIPVACLMYVEGRQHEIHHVHFHHDRQLWKTLTTSLSPVKDNFADNEPIILGALNYDILADSPIEIGNHEVATFIVGGAIHEVALIANRKHDIGWLTQQLQRIVEVERDFWGDLPYDRYIFMLLVGEGQRGGLEHARCNVSAVEPLAFTDKTAAQNMLTLLVHEYFHTWNVKRIRPMELGPFDYSSENYSAMLWLAEGITSYYDDLLSYRCGFFTRDEYIGNLSAQHFGRLDRIPGRFAMSVRDSSFLAWVKLYSLSPDMNNRFPSYYLKGGVIGILLDMYIIAESLGKKRLDDGMKALWQLYKERPETGLTEDETIDSIEQSTSVPIRGVFWDWLNSTAELPYNEILSRFGLVYGKPPAMDIPDLTQMQYFKDNLQLPASLPSVVVGMSLKEESGRLIVREVEDGSPAAEAGFGIDDEILFVGGQRITTMKSFAEAIQQNGQGIPVDITASCDGMLFNAILTPKADMPNTLYISPEITREQRALLDVWLAR